MTEGIRASALSGYTDCARRAAANLYRQSLADAGFYVNSERQNVGAAVGTGAHASLEYSLNQKIDTGALGHDDVAEGVALQALHTDAENGLEYDSITQNMNQAEKQVLRHSRIIRASVAPQIEPVETEIYIETEYRGVPVTGHLDFREPTSAGDLKTGKISRMNAPQYGMYAMLADTIGHSVTKFKEYFSKTVALNKASPEPSLIEYDVEKSKAHALTILDYMVDDYKAFIVSGNPKEFRANPSSMLCGAKYCPAFGTSFCQEHKEKS